MARPPGAAGSHQASEHPTSSVACVNFLVMMTETALLTVGVVVGVDLILASWTTSYI